MFSSVPVLDVTTDNLSEVLPSLRVAVQSASFVAVDCELSGLGDRKALNAHSIDERYENVSRVAKTRAVIALGVSCFRHRGKRGEEEGGMKDRYTVRTFNIMVLCSEDYIVEPSALRFLVEHGFDFQTQYAKGISYYRGDDRPDHASCPLRDLMSLLVTSRAPLVIHNGLVDLVFLYQNLYAQLPRSLSSFVADLAQMFPSGIYDTKYLADYVDRAKASYLTYLFRKQQRFNADRASSGRRHVGLDFPSYPDGCTYVVERGCALKNGDGDDNGDDIDAKTSVCDSYSHHGHCPLGAACEHSHDIDLILERKEGFGRKRRKDGEAADSSPKRVRSETNGACASVPASPTLFGGGHRAGFDAFMTGFVLCAHLAFRDRRTPREEGADFLPALLGTEEEVNRVYLACKDFPLLVQRSAFAKNSIGHHRKYGLLNGSGEEVKEDRLNY